MLRIWGRANSVNVQKVMWTVGELGLAHERIDAGMAFGKNRDPEFLELNPNGLVPTLEDAGFVLWESNSIVRYLAAKHDRGGLWPEALESRATAEQWMDWQLSKLAFGLGPLFTQLIRTPAEQRDSSIIERGVAQCLELFGILDRALERQPFLTGPRLSMGDIPVGALTHRWYALDVDHADFHNLRRWYQALAGRSAFQRTVMLPLS